MTDAYISESRSLWPLYTHYGRLWCRLQMMAVPHLLLSGSNAAQAFGASVSAKVSGD